jgi:hypothetical protein
MRMINRTVTFLLLAWVVVGCSTGSQTWVVGQNKRLSHLDRSDVIAGTQAARNYIEAWTKQDYRKMWTLRNKHCRGHYQAFVRLAKTWRQKGVEHDYGSTIAAADAEAINKSLTLLNGVSDEQARMLLSLGLVDEAVFDRLRKKGWPDRVMVMKLRVAGHESLILLVKEDGQWSVVNDPGTLDKSMVGRSIPGF